MVHGSFTGIRIGVATTKAFVDSLNIKAIGVNSLEVLSHNVSENGIICSLIDAKNSNVYNEIFENIDGNYIIRRKASFDNIDSLLLEIKNLAPNYSITFVGDAIIKNKDKILNILPNSKFAKNNALSSINLGIAGLYHFKNDVSSILEPLYLRKPGAEQKLEEKSNGVN